MSRKFSNLWNSLPGNNKANKKKSAPNLDSNESLIENSDNVELKINEVCAIQNEIITKLSKLETDIQKAQAAKSANNHKQKPSMPQIGTGDVIGLQTFFNYLDDLKKKCSCDQIYDSLQRSTQEFNVKITSKDIQNLFQNLSEILPPLATANHNYLPTFKLDVRIPLDLSIHQADEVQLDDIKFKIKDKETKEIFYSIYLLENFQVEKFIGSGSYGRVYLVNSKDTNQKFAMKVRRKTYSLESPNFSTSDELIQNCKNEKLIGKYASRSRNLVKLYATLQNQSYFFYFMEYLNAGTLFSLTDKINPKNEDLIAYFASQIIIGIKCLHEYGIIHRDLRLENVLVDVNGNCKIADFNLSKRIKKNKKTTTQVSTIAYSAPEIFSKEGYDALVDYWALGVIVYLLKTKKFPFKNIEDIKSERYEHQDEFLQSKQTNKFDLNHFVFDLLQFNIKKRLFSPEFEFGYKKYLYSTEEWSNIKRGNFKPPESFKQIFDGFDEVADENRRSPIVSNINNKTLAFTDILCNENIADFKGFTFISQEFLKKIILVDK